MKHFIFIVFMALVLMSCTQQERARDWGGTTNQDIPDKIVMVTWKNADLWILTREPKPGEIPETYKLQESASFGIFEGMVILKETFKPVPLLKVDQKPIKEN